jgi:hypothetical protein
MFIFPFRFAPGGLTLGSAGLKEGKKAPGERLPALTPVPDGVEFGKISLTDQDNSPKTRTAASSSRNAVSFSSARTTKRSRSLVEIPGIAICLAERRNMVLRCFQDGFLTHVHKYLGFLVTDPVDMLR